MPDHLPLPPHAGRVAEALRTLERDRRRSLVHDARAAGDNHRRGNDLITREQVALMIVAHHERHSLRGWIRREWRRITASVRTWHARADAKTRADHRLSRGGR